MKEKDFEENEKEINIINNNKENSILLLNAEILEDKNKKERKSIDSSSLNEIDLEDIKVGNKILCPVPNCFENCIIMIEPHFFEVNYDCGKHNNKIDIIKYIKDSGISKNDKEKCFKCELTYEKIKEDEENKILYKCYCGKNICKKCKKDHLDENKENKKEHNMIDFKYKDYKCCCSNKNKKYNSFCLTCKKNLCQICDENHGGHEKKNFGELSNLSEEKKKIIIKEIEIQKKLIDKFNKIIDDWFKKVKAIIDKYKMKLDLYYQINLNIIKRYDTNTNYYEEIKNTEYIHTYFDDNFNNLINSGDDFKRQNSIICNLLNDNLEKYKDISEIDPVKVIKNIQLKDSISLNGCANHLCEIKKDETLIVGTNNVNINKDELYLFKEDNQNKENFIPQLSKEENSQILGLKVLKTGNLLIVNEKYSEIREASKTANSLKFIQSIKLEQEDERFIDTIELINGFLISISYSITNQYKNNIIFWKKNIMKGNYEIYNKIPKKERPIQILEINKEKFVVLFENNILCCYDSKNGDETELPKIENPIVFKKMFKILEEGILFINKKNMVLFSISSLQQKSFHAEFNIINICQIYNSNKYFFASFSEENNHGFLIMKIDLNKYKLYFKKYKDGAHSLKINCIYNRNKFDIITCSDDKTIKIWKINI